MCSAAAVVLIGTPAIRALKSRRWLQPMRHEDCPPLKPLQVAKQGTPTMGGLLVLAVAVPVAIIFGGALAIEGWLLLGATLALGALGLVDDYRKLTQPNAQGLPSMPKLWAALALGAAVGAILAMQSPTARLLRLPWGGWVDPHWLWIPLSMATLAGSAHAVNLTDGMDGLAAGCLAVAFAAMGWVGYGADAQTIPMWCASLAGACVGFLWFNGNPASVFLGDVGALGLGGALGVLALVSHTALLLFIIGGVFVAEAVSVMLQVGTYRLTNKRRLFRVAPLHHHFQVGGVAEPKLVIRFWIAALWLGALGLLAAGGSQ